jgi:nucleoside-diphosphate kinase
MEQTFAIIKPDAVEKGATGAILDRVEKEGFVIRGMRKVHMSKGEAEGFYAVHRERPFFGDLVAFMTSGPAVVLCLERDGAIEKWREVIGPTDSTKAAPDTIRGQFGTDIERNACHGSDAPETAAVEVAYWFRGIELV